MLTTIGHHKLFLQKKNILPKTVFCQKCHETLKCDMKVKGDHWWSVNLQVFTFAVNVSYWHSWEIVRYLVSVVDKYGCDRCNQWEPQSKNCSKIFQLVQASFNQVIKKFQCALSCISLTLSCLLHPIHCTVPSIPYVEL